MNAEAEDFWERAKAALLVARNDLSLNPDAAASRAYYAALYAVSAWFALEQRTFRRHSAAEAAVHRDLVRPGTWSPELGQGYSRLVRLRNTADYGGGQHVPPPEAERAIETAANILRAVAKMHPEGFGGLEE